MPKKANLVTILREEIRRVARREIRGKTATVRKASAQYRSDIAALKRELKAAERRIEALESEVRRGRKRAAETADTKGKRFSARSVKAHRAKLDLSAADYGELCGVSGNTIYLWEQGQSRPRAKAFAAWIAIRGMGKRAALARLDQ